MCINTQFNEENSNNACYKVQDPFYKYSNVFSINTHLIRNNALCGGNSTV
jgi:hypothetical protein